MRIDFGLVLAIILEYIFFIYYADTLFYRKRGKLFCYSFIALLNAIHLTICVFGNSFINIAVLTFINILSFYVCYHMSFKNVLFQSVLLVVISAASEWLIVFIPYIGIMPNNTTAMNSHQSLILTLTSKALYLVGLMIVSRFFSKNKKSYGTPSMILILIPCFSVAAFLFMLKVNVTSNYLSCVFLLLILINLVLLVANKIMINKDLEIAELKEETQKEAVVLDEYLMLKEKFEKINVLHHDFKEHMNALSLLIDNDNKKAKEYIKTIYKEEADAQYIKYTDSDMLNILLSKKRDECGKNGIEFVIDPIQARMSFLKDTDVIALFSNLINNAMESCINSEEKKIFLNIYTANENFIVIELENTSDKKPLVIDGMLRTHKSNKDLHGIGMNSIRRTLKKYAGDLSWTYNANDKIFCTKVVIQCSNTVQSE